MPAAEIEDWSNHHVGQMQLTRTIVGFVNLLVGVLILVKVMGWV